MSSSIPSMFDTHGVGANLIRSLGWALTGISCLVALIVGIMVLYAFFRSRTPQESPSDIGREHPDRAIRMIFTGGVALPGLILIGAFGATLGVQNKLAPLPTAPAATIEITGHRWWWEVRYDGLTPDETVTSANELHLPVGEPVRVKVMASDVVHSFWIPQLAGKMDAIPGQENWMWIEATDPGTYRGECTEYCGVQHAHMDLVVVAQSPDQFTAWLASERRPAATPTDSLATAGEHVFHRASCLACHAIRGTDMIATLGPDLTHIGSRQMIGAGLLPNTHNALGSWISNAPALKPGIVMPKIPLDSADLRAVTAYLETLK